PATRVDRLAAELALEHAWSEDALVHLPARTVVQHAFLPALVRVALARLAAEDDQLASHSPRFGEELHALRLFEVAVEEAREDALERAVLERQREGVAGDECRARDALAGDREHRCALVEAGDRSAKMLCEEARSAGDVERAPWWERSQGR